MKYIENTIQLFEYYKHLGDRSLDQIPDEKLNWQPNEESNSMAMIVKHMAGNMLSRWTDFRTSDGEKTWRNREAEFDNDLKTRAEIIAYWNKGWTVLFEALRPIADEELDQMVYIRNQGHTIVEAANRQLGHYAYHVGQMVFLAKMIQNTDWESLSIPKGKSKAYNDDKFSKEKSKQHFASEFIKNGDEQSST